MTMILDQTYAKIGIETTPGRLGIETQRAQLDIHQKQAKIDIHTEQVKVEIDSYESRASAGLKNNSDLSQEAAELGKQQVMDYISKTASDGDTLAAIENGGNPIASFAIRDTNIEHEFNIDYIPKVGPRISVRGGVRLDPENNAAGVNNGVDGTFTPARISFNNTPSHVNISMLQYASIKMSYQPNGSKVDISI